MISIIWYFSQYYRNTICEKYHIIILSNIIGILLPLLSNDLLSPSVKLWIHGWRSHPPGRARQILVTLKWICCCSRNGWELGVPHLRKPPYVGVWHYSKLVTIDTKKSHKLNRVQLELLDFRVDITMVIIISITRDFWPLQSYAHVIQPKRKKSWNCTSNTHRIL